MPDTLVETEAERARATLRDLRYREGELGAEISLMKEFEDYCQMRRARLELRRALVVIDIQQAERAMGLLEEGRQ